MAVPSNSNGNTNQTEEPQIIGDPIFDQPNGTSNSVTNPGTQQVHDASQGFYDIKPIPEFHPSNFSPTTLGIILLLAVLVWLLIRRFLKKSPAPAEPPIPADVRALKALGEIELERKRPAAVVRNIAAEISLVLRTFIEATFEFPATDRTRAELGEQLPKIIREKLPIISQDQGKEYSNQCISILRLLERASFADDAERVISPAGEEIGSSISNAKRLVVELTKEVGREKERLRHAVEQS